MIRLWGPLEPLQEPAAGTGLDKLAPVVDKMMGEQFLRLKTFAETGKPG